MAPPRIENGLEALPEWGSHPRAFPLPEVRQQICHSHCDGVAQQQNRNERR